MSRRGCSSGGRRCPDCSIGPGAAIRLREYLGATPRFDVDTITEIEKLDEELPHLTPVSLDGLRRDIEAHGDDLSLDLGYLLARHVLAPKHHWHDAAERKAIAKLFATGAKKASG